MKRRQQPNPVSEEALRWAAPTSLIVALITLIWVIASNS
jgi:hypothetical protein